jgi:hypothetical protein
VVLRQASGCGDGPAEVVQADVGRFRTAALIGVVIVDGCQFVIGQFEIEDLEVIGDAVRLGRLRDDRTALCRCQRSITCAGVLPCVSASLPITGSSSVRPWLPSR